MICYTHIKEGVFKFTAVFFVFLMIISLNSKKVIAQYYGENVSIPVVVVDKKIKLPTTGKYVDNIDKQTYVFKEGEQIEFDISVENRSTETIYDLNLNDILPKYLKLQFYFGNKNSSGLNTYISVLKPGETLKYSIVALIDDLPSRSSIYDIKLTNRVCASNSTTSDCDNSVYYIETKTMPVTGSSSVLMIQTILLSTLVGGSLILKKLVRGY
jgi:uncharacterized repeat protein (TIGR01451 family)